MADSESPDVIQYPLVIARRCCEALRDLYLNGSPVTIATAESVTGGLIATALTGVSGCRSTSWFMGGFVANSRASKETLLGLPVEKLTKQVSKECVSAMAEAARTKLQTDLAVAATGYASAGPSVGPEDRVGRIWFAVAHASGTFSEVEEYNGTPMAIRRQATDRALQLLLDFVHRRRSIEGEDHV